MVDYVRGVAHLILNLAGIFGNSWVMLILHRHWKDLGQYPFYLSVLSLAISDNTYLVAKLLIEVPTCFMGQFYPDTVRFGFGSVHSLGFFGVLFTSLFIAVNRFAVFGWPALNARVFERPNIKYTAAIPLMLSLTIVTCSFGLRFFDATAVGCRRDFNATTLYWQGVGDEDSPTLCPPYRAFIIILTLVTPWFLIACYVITFFILRAQRVIASAQTLKQEKSLIIQGVLIGGTLILLISTYWIQNIPAAARRITPTIDFIISVIHIVNSCINPILYFACNRIIREYQLESIGYKKHTSPHTTITFTAKKRSKAGDLSQAVGDKRSMAEVA